MNIPSLQEIENGLTFLKNVEWDKLSLVKIDDYINNIEQYIGNTFGLFFRTRSRYNSEVLNQSIHHYRSVFRVRPFKESINKELIAEFSNPPASAVNELGRANFPYYPVFYGSPHVGTAMLETLETLKPKFNPQGNNYFYLSEWIMKEFIPLHITWFTFGRYNSISDLSFFSEHHLEDIFIKMKVTSKEEKIQLQKLMEAFAELFEQPNNHYLAAYMAHIHLYHNDKTRTELFIYPSIQTEKVSLNYAIHPNTVLHKMYLKRVYKLQIKNYEKKGFGKVDYEVVIPDICARNDYNGNLIWREVNEAEKKDFEVLFPRNVAE